ncbi:MAG: hypothetical protein NDI63_13730 [Pseudobdellovibrio sp.]|nr:hypothetical protein [Pseudobdellovibrio sp.]
MKSLLTLAIVLASTSAFATRARVTALGNAAHLVDDSTTYSKPATIFSLSDSLTIESGKTDLVPGTDASTALGAEALMIRSAGDAKWALSLGHDDERTFAQRAEADANNAGIAIIGQQNPLEVSYGMKNGDMAWAGTLVYSNFNNKVTEVKESTMGLKFGAATSTWDATVDLGLADKWEAGGAVNDEFKGKSNVAVRGGFWVASDMYAYADVAMGGYEVTDAGAVVSEVKTTDITVGAVNTMKSEGNEFFWGAGLASSQSKDSKATGAAIEKASSLMLPLIIGVEANAASWLTLRGSVTQNVLIQNEKEETTTATTTETSPGTNSTTFAAGAGLKLGKLALDGSILANNTQTVNSANLLGTVGLTYAF